MSTIPPPRHLYHIVQAFWFSQARNSILFNPSVAIWVPEDMIFGIPDRIRTCDLLLRRQLLYPAELRRHVLVLEAGIEPARAQGPQDFKSGVSTYSTTRAFIVLKNYGTNIIDFFEIDNLLSETFFIKSVDFVLFGIIYVVQSNS